MFFPEDDKIQGWAESGAATGFQNKHPENEHRLLSLLSPGPSVYKRGVFFFSLLMPESV